MQKDFVFWPEDYWGLKSMGNYEMDLYWHFYFIHYNNKEEKKKSGKLLFQHKAKFKSQIKHKPRDSGTLTRCDQKVNNNFKFPFLFFCSVGAYVCYIG